MRRPPAPAPEPKLLHQGPHTAGILRRSHASTSWEAGVRGGCPQPSAAHTWAPCSSDPPPTPYTQHTQHNTVTKKQPKCTQHLLFWMSRLNRKEARKGTVHCILTVNSFTNLLQLWCHPALPAIISFQNSYFIPCTCSKWQTQPFCQMDKMPQGREEIRIHSLPGFLIPYSQCYFTKTLVFLFQIKFRGFGGGIFVWRLSCLWVFWPTLQNSSLCTCTMSTCSVHTSIYIEGIGCLRVFSFPPNDISVNKWVLHMSQTKPWGCPLAYIKPFESVNEVLDVIYILDCLTHTQKYTHMLLLGIPQCWPFWL